MSGTPTELAVVSQTANVPAEKKRLSDVIDFRAKGQALREYAKTVHADLPHGSRRAQAASVVRWRIRIERMPAVLPRASFPARIR